jgi:hypothetical protein
MMRSRFATNAARSAVVLLSLLLLIGSQSWAVCMYMEHWTGAILWGSKLVKLVKWSSHGAACITCCMSLSCIESG